MAQREFSSRVVGVGSGALFGLFMGIYSYLDDGRVWTSVIAGVLGGVFFGVFMGRWSVRQRRRAVATLGSGTPTAAPAALRTAAKDPASVDPEVRAEALRITEFQLVEFNRTKRRTILIFAVLLVLDLVLALTSSPWFWCGVVLFVGFLILTVVTGARLQRTVARLRAASSPG